MKIKNYRKKLVMLCFILLLAGTLITAVGFGTTGFQYSKLKDKLKNDRWYQTIHINSSGDFWYGIDLGDIQIFTIGDSE